MPQSLSPIISQYAAQLHRDQIASSQAGNMHRNTITHSSPVHSSPVHSSPVHSSPVHRSPIHSYPVHSPPVHTGEVSSIFLGTIYHPSPGSQIVTTTDPPNNDDFEPFDEPPRTPVTVQPPWDQLNSAIYDKSEHPNSPEINHVLYDGVRIYEPMEPPRFDSSIPPASPRHSRLLLSPQPTTPLTSPTKSNDSLSGFAVHATTVNAFAATASSNSPPCLGSRSLSPKVLNTLNFLCQPQMG